MLLSRAKPSSPNSGRPGTGSGSVKGKDKRPSLESFLSTRDFSGAAALVEFLVQSGETDTICSTSIDKHSWLAYIYFHLHDFVKCQSYLEAILKDDPSSTYSVLYESACQFYLGNFNEAIKLASSGPTCSLKHRLLFHCAHRLADEKMLVENHGKLTESIEDQLALAAIHFLRGHYEEAIEIYTRLLLEHREYLAIHVYIAICYYKLDYYDVALEILNPYLTANPDSSIALNLKACSHFRLYDGKSAIQQLQPYMEKGQALATVQNTFSAHTLINHNLVVFRSGESALKVLPPLVDIVPEARLNLCIYYLKAGDIDEAYKLMKDFEPNTPQEYILKGVAHAAYGQTNQSSEDLQLSQQYFQLIGESESERDTIPGRQAMASCYFLLQQFDEVIVYLSSIQAYFQTDDRFNWNYGLALTKAGRYTEAAQAFANIQNQARRKQYDFIAWLARIYINTGEASQAWELYLEMETTTNSFNLLILIANECYRTQAYYYAAKAFDVLWKLDPITEYWEGKRGACCGVLQQLIQGKEKRSHLAEIINLLKSNNATPQAQFIARVMNKYWLETSEYDI